MPIDRGILEQQLQALGEGSSWWEQRELRDLPAVLHADEEIRAITRGKIGRLRSIRREWLIIVTDRRLLCLRSGAASWRQLEVIATQISSVTLRVGVFRGRVLVATSDRTYRLHVAGADAYKLVTALSNVAKCGQDTKSGPTHLVRRVVGHVLALPAAAFNPPPARALPPATASANAAEQRYQQLEEHIQELQQQVQFLEQLLRQRQASSAVEPELQSSGKFD